MNLSKQSRTIENVKPNLNSMFLNPVIGYYKLNMKLVELFPNTKKSTDINLLNFVHGY